MCEVALRGKKKEEDEDEEKPIGCQLQLNTILYEKFGEISQVYSNFQ